MGHNLNECVEESSVKTSNKKGSNFLVLKDDIHDSSYADWGVILEDPTASYYELEAVKNKSTVTVMTRTITRNIAKLKKLILMMINMKGLLSYRRTYYAPSKTNQQ